MELGKVIHISEDVIASATIQHNFDNYLYHRWQLKSVATYGYTHFYKVDDSKGRLFFKDMRMNLYVGHEVEIEIRYDLKITINPSEAMFEIIENEIVDPKCNNDYLLDIHNKFTDKYRKDKGL